jgi:flagellar hook-length control protein FliK
VAAATTSAAAGVTISAAASVPAVVPSPSPDAAANAKAAVQAAATEATTAPVPQGATQSVATAATATTGLALTDAVAAGAPVETKTTLLNPPLAAPAKSAADIGSGAPDSSNAARAADTPQNNIAPQPAAAARPDAGNDRVATARADVPANSSPASPAVEAAHEHSPASATVHATADSSGTAVQTTATVQPLGASAPAAPSFSVTAASNAVVPLSGLALEIAVSARSGKSRFEIRLDPADLGRIDVRIDVDRSGRVTSHLTVEKPETLSMLRQDAPQLQRALDDAGLKTGNGGLQFSLRDQSSSGQDGNETGRNAQRLVISDDETIPAAVAGRSYGRVLGSSSGVDIRV